jgi:hypothetical protein
VSIWALDGWPLARFVSGLPGIADLLRTYPGAGPDVGYGSGQRFYDDLARTSVDYATAMDRADRVMADLVKVREPDAGVYAGWPITDYVYDFQQQKHAERPQEVPRPREDLGPAPPLGAIILIPMQGQPLPQSDDRSPGGGIYLLPMPAPRPPSIDVPGLPGGIYIDPLPVVVPAPATETRLPGGITVVPITTPIPSQPNPGRLPPGITLVPALPPIPTPAPPPQQGPPGPPGPPGPSGQAAPGVVFPPELLATIQATAQLVLDISHAVDSIGDSLSIKLSNATARIEGRINAIVDDIDRQLRLDVQSIIDSIGASEAHILSALTAETADIERTVQTSADAIVSQISGQVTDLAGGIEQAFTAGSDTIANAIGALPDALAGLKLDPAELLDAVYTFGGAAWPSWMEPLKQLVNYATRGVLDGLEDDAVALLTGTLDQILADPTAPAPVRNLAAQLRQPQHALVALLLIPALIVVAKAAIELPLAPLLNQWGHTINRAYPTEIPSPPELGIARRLGKLDPATYADLMAQNGLEAKYADLLLSNQEQVLAAESLLELWRRDQITETQLRAEMQRIGYSDVAIERLWSMRYTVPSASDVARFIIKDAYNDTLMKELGHDDEWDQTKNLAAFQAAGVKERDALLLYRSSWSPPSNTQAFAMLHRTADSTADPSAAHYADEGIAWTTVVGIDRVKELLKINDVPRLWRDAYVALSYTPLTRVDIRRMHKLGVLSPGQVTRAYMDLGYSFENAQRMKEFTAALNGAERKNESEIFRAPVRTRVITDFLAGTIDQPTAERLLAGVGYDDAETAQWWPAALELREANQRAAIRDDVGRLFVDGFWSEAQATDRLAYAGFDTDTTAHLIEDWTLDRELKMDRASLKEQRDLSKAEILEAYRDGISDRSQTLSFLMAAGYDQTESETIVALQDARTERELRRLDIDAIHTQYTRGGIDRSTASSQLDALGLPVRSRQAYLSRWDAELRKAPPVLSDTELHALYLRGVTTRDGARKQLLGKGLRPDAVDQLLALWDSDRLIALSKFSDTQIKRLIGSELLLRPEVEAIFKQRGLSESNARKLAATYF